MTEIIKIERFGQVFEYEKIGNDTYIESWRSEQEKTLLKSIHKLYPFYCSKCRFLTKNRENLQIWCDCVKEDQKYTKTG